MASIEPSWDESLEHLERIGRCCQALRRLPWLSDTPEAEFMDKLLAFDSEYWAFTRYLSLPLYEELERLLLEFPLTNLQQPEVAVVVPVCRADPDLLRRALQSIRCQLGVAIHLLISVDGRQEDLDLVDTLLEEWGRTGPGWQVDVLYSSSNRGVGMCRNLALQQVRSDFFTCLDSDDLFHPLRCLHGLHLMALHGVRRVNTSFSRVSIRLKKLFLFGGQLQMFGHNSFMAKRELLDEYGYLADLRRHEDTEMMQRLRFFHEPMYDSGVVGHYLNMEADPSYESLSTDMHVERHPIEGHPYLCGSIWYAITPDRRQLNAEFEATYRQVISDGLSRIFPPNPLNS